MAEGEKPKIPEVVMGMEELKRLDVLLELGKLAAAGLAANGIIVFHRHADGGICIANPAKVYLDVGALVVDESANEHPPFRWVRPIVGAERPTYVSWRNGKLWEIELLEPEQRETNHGDEEVTAQED